MMRYFWAAVLATVPFAVPLAFLGLGKLFGAV